MFCLKSEGRRCLFADEHLNDFHRTDGTSASSYFATEAVELSVLS